MKNIEIVAISDTHGTHRYMPEIPPGDILIHAGDITRMGEAEVLSDFNDFLGSLPHRYKIVIAGNHDFCFQHHPEEARAILTNAIYLEDQHVTLEGIKIYGSPWQPTYHNWAFNVDRGRPIRKKWKLIPKDTDILITHGPPHGHGDRIYRGELVGCKELTKFVEKIKPKYHIFGHIHEDFGITQNEHTTFINAAILDFRNPVNPATKFNYTLLE